MGESLGERIRRLSRIAKASHVQYCRDVAQRDAAIKEADDADWRIEDVMHWSGLSRAQAHRLMYRERIA